MVDIRFEGDSAPIRPRLPNQDSKLTKFFIEHSFGLINNQAQATVAQIILCIALFSVAFILFSNTAEPKISQPSKELLERRQPIGPIN
jgi:hypothetical protein